MEMDFKKTVIPGYRMPLCQVQSMEQTQDLRIPDSEGDIGSVLGCWGQVLLRSKEWHSDSVSLSGGVMAWVLYAPEEGGMPATVESWIPFQMKWDMQDVQQDGTLLAFPTLQSIDARNVSARKMVIRANISVLAQAIEPVDADVYQPEKLPEDIYLRKQTYPVEMPCDAGEMPFQIDEELSLSESQPSVHKLLFYHLKPVITECRVLSDKLLFRGKLLLHFVYITENGNIHTWDSETGFSKYTQLNKEHDGSSSLRIIPVLTGSELDVQENRIQLKASLAAQYIIYDRIMLETVTDAYSPIRDVSVNKTRVNAMIRLDAADKSVVFEQTSQFSAQKILDVSCCFGNANVRQTGDMLDCEMIGSFHVLGADENGLLQGHTVRCESQFQIPTDSSNSMCIYPSQLSKVEIMPDGDGIRLKADADIGCDTFSCSGIETVSALNLSEARESDPARPSIILKQVGDEQLWDLAKACGSSVSAIQEANRLQNEPQPGQIILIPVH